MKPFRSMAQPIRHITHTVILLACILWIGPAGAASLDELRSLALDLVNRARADHGLNPLKLDHALDAAAQRHAEDMLHRTYFAHEYRRAAPCSTGSSKRAAALG